MGREILYTILCWPIFTLPSLIVLHTLKNNNLPDSLKAVQLCTTLTNFSLNMSCHILHAYTTTIFFFIQRSSFLFVKAIRCGHGISAPKGWRIRDPHLTLSLSAKLKRGNTDSTVWILCTHVPFMKDSESFSAEIEMGNTEH